MPIVRRAYAVTAVAWLATLPIATFAATRVHASELTHAVAFAVYSNGGLVCHQKPERSFHLWAAQLPVCARCTGIYLGAAIAIARRLQPSEWLQPSGRLHASADLWRSPKGIALLASLPTIATLVFEWSTGVMPSNTIRFAAGLPLGAVVSWLVLSGPAQVN